MALLIILSGLPGSGKSAIARGLAQRTGAVWLRVDSIEQAIRDSGVVEGALDDVGYRAAYAVAEDNLRLGRDVIGDCVNPWGLTRDAWRDTGLRSGAAVLDVEIVCSDRQEHRRRVENRSVDIPGLRLPSWAEVVARDYHPWERQVLVVDTSLHDVADCVAIIAGALKV